MIARVIVDVPSRQTDRPFDYLVPEALKAGITIGSRVAVPFGPRKILGFVIEVKTTDVDTPLDQLREIIAVLDAAPPLTVELVELSRWMGATYLCPRIVALQAMIPTALKARFHQGKNMVRDRLFVKSALTVCPPEDQSVLENALLDISGRAIRQKEVISHFIDHPDPVPLAQLCANLNVGTQTVKILVDKGILILEERETFRDPYAHRSFEKSEPLPLTREQHSAFIAIKESLTLRRFSQFLLHGVTGSGKTEIYLQAIQECLKLNREAIVLVPEIALTPQMVERFKGRFGSEVAVLHSRLSQGERYDEWRKIQAGMARVAIGARSAVFAPFAKPGLIIIDEEHETSYKQEDSPKYHAREVAEMRAKYHDAALVLGSATPSLESYHRSESGSLRRLSLSTRVEGRPLPIVSIADMREELQAGNRSMFSRILYKEIEERLHRKEQIILLLNRRGYSTFVMCRSCGQVCECPHCDISLTYHRHSLTVRCHYCGYADREVQQCPQCGSGQIRYFGTGTQRVEEELLGLFPAIRVIRMDLDTTTEKGSHEKWLDMFQKQQADVLLGTQMVAKGLDFPNVTLVGVLAADTVLHLPDFRAAERTFQLLTQVAGRAGRHELPGKVVIQTYAPEHYSVKCASKHDYFSFAAREMTYRRQMFYPPMCRLILITISGEQLPQIVQTGEKLVVHLKKLLSETVPDNIDNEAYFAVLGPASSPIARIKDRYRFQCIVKFAKQLPAPAIVERAIADITEKGQLQIIVDVDPQMLM